MCGLIGVASTMGTKNEGNRRDAFIEGLIADQFRGADSTGIAVIRRSERQKPALVFKRGVNASEFIEFRQFADLMRPFDQYQYVIGHNRAATRERVNNQNAHPFQVENITLVHNGTIYNQNELNVQDLVPAPVDSAYIAASFVKNGVKETLEKLNGGFALVWHDATDGTLNFARNEAKPLYMGYLKEENSMFWASELYMLHWILHRNGLEVEGKYRTTSPHVWYRFNPDNLREYERIPFVKRVKEEGTRTQNSSAPRSNGGTELVWDPKTEKLERAGQTPTKPHGSEAPTSSLYEPRKGGPAPQSKKRVKKVTEDLRKMGYAYGALICVKPESFHSYTNQRDKYGDIHASTLGRVIAKPVLVPHMKYDEWQKCARGGGIYGNVCNIREINNKKILVIDFNEPITAEYVWKTDARPSQAPKEGGPLGPFPSTRSSAEASGPNYAKADDDEGDVEKFEGPLGRKISRAKWLELTQHGCGNCATDLAPSMHGAIQWVGDGYSTPLCPHCACDEAVAIRLYGGI